MRTYLLFLAFISSSSLAAPACKIPELPKFGNISYHQIRARLIESGFTPDMRKHDPDMMPAEEYHALGYFEVCDIGNQQITYAWVSPKKIKFTVYTTHIGGNGIRCGHTDCIKGY